jgi:SCY1-like protein 1
VETFVEHLDSKVVNEQVFPHIQNGFIDQVRRSSSIGNINRFSNRCHFQEPMIREKTVIAMIHLAAKLSQSNLDEVVIMKNFSRLLRDEQAGIRYSVTKWTNENIFSNFRVNGNAIIDFHTIIDDLTTLFRTNTTVCLGKIAKYLHYTTRQKVLIPAFTGKIRDPFPPCRIAAINALAATQNFYTVEETGCKVSTAWKTNTSSRLN